MSFLDFFRRKESKAVVASPAIALVQPPSAIFSERNYKAFADEGFKKNVIAFRSVLRIAEAISQIPVQLKKYNTKTDDVVDDHPLLDLISKPNPLQPYESFVQGVIANFLISGNTYIQGVAGSGKIPLELIALRPDRMSVIPGRYSLPAAFKYKEGPTERIFPVDQVTGDSSIMHMKTFNPLNDWLGMSFIEAASFAVDQHNEAGKWNLSLLQNGARPSGAFIYAPKNDPNALMSEEQRRSMQTVIADQRSGSKNAGKPLLLDGAMDWKEMGFNPKDMDWLEGKNTSARDISLAFGVPPNLLGIPGDNTYANYSEAKLAFYLDTVIPLMKLWFGYLNSWLVPTFGDDLYLCGDLSALEALEPLREKKWTQISGASFLSINEKREQLGYPRYEPANDPADALFVMGTMTPLEMAFDSLDGDGAEEDGSDFEDSEDEEDPKKPADEEEEPEEVDEEEETDKAKSIVSGGGRLAYFGGKAFNLRGKNSKQKYRALVIKRRERLGIAFKTQIKNVWKKEAALMVHATKGITFENVESKVDDVLSKTKGDFTRVMYANLKSIMRIFGQDILDLGKSIAPNIEVKDAETYFESFLDQYIERNAGSRITKIYGNTKKRVVKEIRSVLQNSLRDGSTPNDMVKSVQSLYKGFSIGRAETIVKTEIGIASNEAHRDAAKALKINDMKKTWISDQTETARGLGKYDHTNHIEMNETTIGLNEKFRVMSEDGDDDMEGPGDPEAPADQIINCKCVLIFSVGKNGDEE